MKLTRQETYARIKELKGIMSSHYLRTQEYEELIELQDSIIDRYRKCIDLSEISDEELEEQDGYQ